MNINNFRLLIDDNNDIINTYTKFFTEKIIKTKIDVININYLCQNKNLLKNDKIFKISDFITNNDDIINIIGAGVSLKTNNDDIIKINKNAIIRGKNTLNIIKNNNIDVSQIKLGDPALLLSYLITINKVQKKYKYGIIVNDENQDYIKTIISDKIINDFIIINISTNNFDKLANEIFSCEQIITSELYGIIYSNSLNIPIAWINLPQYKTDSICISDYLSYHDIINPIDLCNNINKIDEINIKQLIFFDPGDKIFDKKRVLLDEIISLFKSHGLEIHDEFNNKIYDFKTAIDFVINDMKKDKYLIGRIGGIEFDAYIEYKINGFNINSQPFQNLLKYCGYYDTNLSKDIFEKYIKHYENYYNSCNLLLVGSDKLESYYGFMGPEYRYYNHAYKYNNNVDKIIKLDTLNIKKLPKMSYQILESFLFFTDYYPELDGKKILIISPFENEIKSQLKNKDKLFIGKNQIADFNNFKYPNFKSVEYINTFLTTNKYQLPHANLIETFEHYKTRLNALDFDVALLTCGAYAYLFADYIYNVLHKSCIHVGGIGQLYFGIKGGRYMTKYFENLMNENWIYPFQVISENAPGVPDYDGLLGYFKRQ